MTTDPIETLNATFTYKRGDQIQSEDNHGTFVFKGHFNDTIPIALKRYQKVDEKKTIEEVQKVLDILASPNNRHPNFIRYYGHIKQPNFICIAMELCECSVADIIDPKKIERNEKKISEHIRKAVLINLTHKEILRQSSEAVSFLHSLGIIHRNLHPDNFLISCVDPSMDHFMIKLTDFHLSKDIKANSGNTGTTAKEGWVAPESLVDCELTSKVDSFIMGCYYYYVLTGGKHPFGEKNVDKPEANIGVSEQKTRIGNNQYGVYNNWDGGSDWKTGIKGTIIHEEEATWALDMIKDLIKYDESKRESVGDVLLRNKYFQPEGYKIYDHKVAKKPGLCVIITQAKYHNPDEDLCWEDYSGGTYKGVNIDANNLSSTFSSFGYDIISLKHLRGDEIVEYLSQKKLLEIVRGQSNEATLSFKDYASLVVCFLGHGNQGVVCGVDNSQVALNTIQYDAFDDNACPDLKGKPKVFIVLACQGTKPQQKIQSNSNETSALTPPLPTAALTSNFQHEESNRPPVFDFIRLMATIEGYFAYGGDEGSSFINSLCKALDHEYKEKLVNEEKEKNKFEKEEKKILKKSLAKRDLTQLFTMFVTPVVGSNAEYWQTPEFRSSLAKTIRFRRIQDPVHIEPYYDGETELPFQYGRAYYKSLGYKEKKKMSVSDYTSLFWTIYGETIENGITNETVQKAIAWVILNRYNLNQDYWGGNESLEKVCKHRGTDEFEYWKVDARWGTTDETIMNGIYKWLKTVYDGYDDPSWGATIYFKTKQQDLEPTTINIDDFYFYKKLH